MLIALEILAVVAVWLTVRLRGEQALRRQVTCPLDGKRAVLLIVGGRRGVSAVNVVSCSLLGSHRDERTCSRACIQDGAARVARRPSAA